jgi:hypothetical protein
MSTEQITLFPRPIPNRVKDAKTGTTMAYESADGCHVVMRAANAKATGHVLNGLAEFCNHWLYIRRGIVVDSAVLRHELAAREGLTLRDWRDSGWDAIHA